MGSKNRIAKYILPIILKERKKEMTWVEPFVGGANMIDKVEGERIGADANPYLICLFKSLQNGYVPPDRVSEGEYMKVRIEREVNPRTAFIGFGCSYSGKWFGGYARSIRKDTPNADFSNKTARNYCTEAKKNLLNQLPNIIDVNFVLSNYQNLQIPPNSLIYCDPPYEGTTKYRNSLNYDIFWNWCREKSNEGHVVFVSEYKAPGDFECVWQKEIVSSLTKNTGAKRGVEKLFKYKYGN